MQTKTEYLTLCACMHTFIELFIYSRITSMQNKAKQNLDTAKLLYGALIRSNVEFKHYMESVYKGMQKFHRKRTKTGGFVPARRLLQSSEQKLRRN